jgi:hypothetical protein
MDSTNDSSAGTSSFKFVRGHTLFCPAPPLAPNCTVTTVESDKEHISGSRRMTPLDRLSSASEGKYIRPTVLDPGLDKRTMTLLDLRNPKGSPADGLGSKLYCTDDHIYTENVATFVYRTDQLKNQTACMVVLLGAEAFKLRMTFCGNDLFYFKNASKHKSAAGADMKELGAVLLFGLTGSLVVAMEENAPIGSEDALIDRENYICFERALVPLHHDATPDNPFFAFAVELDSTFPSSQSVSGNGFRGRVKKFPFRDRAYFYQQQYALALFSVVDGRPGELLHCVDLRVCAGRQPSEGIPAIVSNRWAVTKQPIVPNTGSGHEEDIKLEKDRKQKAKKLGLPSSCYDQQVLGYLNQPNADFNLSIQCPAILYKDTRSVAPESFPLDLVVTVDVLGNKKITHISVSLVQTCFIHAVPCGREAELLPRAHSINNRYVFQFERKLKEPLKKGHHVVSFPLAEVTDFKTMRLDMIGEEVETVFLESVDGVEVTVLSQLKVQCRVSMGDDICASVFPAVKLAGPRDRVSTRMGEGVSHPCVLRCVNDRFGWCMKEPKPSKK